MTRSGPVACVCHLQIGPQSSLRRSPLSLAPSLGNSGDYVFKMVACWDGGSLDLWVCDGGKLPYSRKAVIWKKNNHLLFISSHWVSGQHCLTHPDIHDFHVVMRWASCPALRQLLLCKFERLNESTIYASPSKTKKNLFKLTYMYLA